MYEGVSVGYDNASGGTAGVHTLSVVRITRGYGAGDCGGGLIGQATRGNAM
jgi:hypothetical protein